MALFRCLRRITIACLLALCGSASGSPAAEPAMTSFSPTGTAKAVRQAHARFSAPMVAIGDPRLAAPFAVDCPVAGEGRWMDSRNWTYDFERTLPGGLHCTFTPAPDLRTLAGAPLTDLSPRAFDTGGPAVLQTEPWAGSTIDEEQIFLLGLDARATTESVLQHARCRAAGIGEAIGVRLIDGEERRLLLDANPSFLRRYLAAVAQTPPAPADAAAAVRSLIADPAAPLVLVQCRQRLPNAAKVSLDWGAGVATASGIASDSPQTFEFETRPEFRARVACERVNQTADCIPALPLRLEFTAAIARDRVHEIRLRLPDGGLRTPLPPGADEREIYAVSFAGPFPERVALTLEVPPDLTDDAGRQLANADAFPREIRTDEDPPLARFAAEFGIIELASPLLPLTVRNLEPLLTSAPVAAAPTPIPSVGRFVVESIGELLGRAPPPEATPVRATIKARTLAVPVTDTAAIARWFMALRGARRDDYRYDEGRDEYVLARRAGATSLLANEPAAHALRVPRASHAKAFEVIGIPLTKPGFYVVEVASDKLGAALFGKPGTYYAQSLALVTNLGVHFKWGRESSLAWVTRLDDGQPVRDARIAVTDCAGAVLWRGRTDRQGRAAITARLPQTRDLPVCEWNSQGLVVSAQVGADTGFVATEWNNGIANWQFGLPGPVWQAPRLASTVIDRSLVRAGATVHMKHVLRRHGERAFGPWVPEPFRVRVRHPDSGDEYPLAARFDARSASGESEWTVPPGARQGTYRIEVAVADSWIDSGEFRVESFRVPQLKGALQVSPDPAVAAHTVTVDLQVTHLSGGGAGLLPVTVRGLVEPRAVAFPEYEGYEFMNGAVIEGLLDHAPDEWGGERTASATRLLEARRVSLDEGGGARVELPDIPVAEKPATLVAEAEYHDPNGEVLTAARRVPLWPSAIVLGMKPAGWALSRERVAFQVLALDLAGKPLPNVDVAVDLLQRLNYSHRKRLIGGFYAYENATEVKKLGAALCRGRTSAQGLLDCGIASPVSGNVILQARARDASDRSSVVHRDVWVAGSEDWWYEVGNEDRMELVPERRRYEPDEVARVQVRMPFRRATALVTVEREGIVDSFVTELSGKAPVVEIPLRHHYAPNVFVSVLAVRGRVAGVQPTALVDLGRPAYKLGITELRVGWRAYELEVEVAPARDVYPVRGTAVVDVRVKPAGGGPVPQDAEIAFAAVDEGLLELAPNGSWQLLEHMLGRRGAEVQTATAQMQVVGRRHFGRKAVPIGGGGGSGPGTRSLFDTLLVWKARVPLDSRGAARVQVPLNDSLSSFRLVAVATGGSDRFGTGEARIRTTQDLMLFPGLPATVRDGDRIRAAFTVRNATAQAIEARLEATVAAHQESGAGASPTTLPPQTMQLAAGASREVAWDYTVPLGATRLAWIVDAAASGERPARDTLRASQTVQPAVPVRTVQASLTQLTAPLELALARPTDSLPARAEVSIVLRPTLVDALSGVREYMAAYHYTCLEQQASKAVVLDDVVQWQALMNELPAYLDGDGLVRYFRSGGRGSDVLSAYLLAIAADSGRPLPDAARTRLREGLRRFVEGRIERASPIATADLALRKLAAMAALARDSGDFDPLWLDAIDETPALWPTAGLIDWLDILTRVQALPRRGERLAAAERALRARLAVQGTALRLANENDVALWWLMNSADVNAARLVLTALTLPGWHDDAPLLARGALARLRAGHWDTTTANAWGMTALRAFVARVEAAPVAGTTEIRLGAEAHTTHWTTAPHGALRSFAWPAEPATLTATHVGGGAPWLEVRARAAVPLTAPHANGLAIERTVTPVVQVERGVWHRGDVYRVRLALEARTDLAWVVVEDPVPAGASVLGTGLGRDSAILAATAASSVTPSFEERSAGAYRAYYEFVPRRKWTAEYTVRLNNAGDYVLPPSRVEAMYAPDVAGETVNQPLVVQP